MIVLSIVIPGEPIAWARVRGTGSNRFTAPEQKSFKRTISQYAWAAGARREKALPKHVAVSLTVRVLVAVPKSWSATDRTAALAGHLRPVVTPDLDNWIKLPMDAFNGLVWTDDAQVVDFGESGKFYSASPCLEITVRRLV